MNGKKVMRLISILITAFLLSAMITGCVVESGTGDSTGTTRATQPVQTEPETTAKKEDRY